jgi:hypothetical protein
MRSTEMPTPTFPPATPAHRRWLATLAALVVLAAVMVGGGAGATAGAADLDAGELDVADLEAPVALADQWLAWGVKSSFTGYVTGPVAGGEAVAADGATPEADGTFRFPALEGLTADADGIEAAFTGSVRFTGHDGVLDVSLSDLRLLVEGDTGVVVADVASRPFGSVSAPQPVETFDDLQVATLDLTAVVPIDAGGGLAAWVDVPATLTEAAVPAFAGSYPADTALDPLSFTLAAAEGTVPVADPAPEAPAPTPPAEPEAPEAPAGGADVEASRDLTAAPAAPALPQAPAAPAAPTVLGAPVSITGGFLDWGVKETFRRYITGNIAQGSIQTSGGASANADGTFRFPARAQGDADVETSQVAAAFDGTVSFSGHGHHGQGSDLLQLSISNIRIDTSAGGGTLVADVVSLPLEGDITDPQAGGEPTTYADVALADLGTVSPVAAGDDGAAWLDVPATLTAAGVPAFSDFYTAGTALDPVSYTLTLSSVPDLPDPPPPGGGDQGDDGTTVDKAQVRQGETITVTGEGFMAGEQVEVWVVPGDVWITTVVADASGKATATFAIPATVPAGSHQVELRGISSGKTLITSSFTVVTGTGGTSGTSGTGGTAGRTGTSTMPRTGTDTTLALVGGSFVLAGVALVAGARARRAAAAR